MQSMHSISIYVIVFCPNGHRMCCVIIVFMDRGCGGKRPCVCCCLWRRRRASWSRRRNEKRERKKEEEEREKMHRGAAEKVQLHHSPRRTFSWSGQRGAASLLRIKGMIKSNIISLPLSSVLCCVDCHGNVLSATACVLGVGGLCMPVCYRHPLHRGAGVRPATD